MALIGELAGKSRYQGGGSAHVNPYNLQTPLNIEKIVMCKAAMRKDIA